MSRGTDPTSTHLYKLLQGHASCTCLPNVISLCHKHTPALTNEQTEKYANWGKRIKDNSLRTITNRRQQLLNTLYNHGQMSIPGHSPHGALPGETTITTSSSSNACNTEEVSRGKKGKKKLRNMPPGATAGRPGIRSAVDADGKGHVGIHLRVPNGEASCGTAVCLKVLRLACTTTNPISYSLRSPLFIPPIHSFLESHVALFPLLTAVPPQAPPSNKSSMRLAYRT